MITKEQLAELKRLALALPEDEWVTGKGATYGGGSPKHEYFVIKPDDDVAICSDVTDPLTEDPSKAYADFISANDPPTVLALIARIEKLEAALNEIASWDEGGEVVPGFDCPYHADIARRALIGK